MSLIEKAGGFGRAGRALLKDRLIPVVAGAAVTVIVAGCAASSGGSGGTKVADSGSTSKGTQSQSSTGESAATPLRLVSVTPQGGTKQANGGAPIVLTFSAPLAASTPLPTLSPKIAGQWQVSGSTATFTPESGFLPGTKVTVSVPGGKQGMTGSAASTLGQAAKVSYTTGQYSARRLQQVLAQLGYLPLTWTANSGSSTTGAVGGTLNDQVSAAYAPPSGTFAFKPGYPSQLTSQWKAGKDNMLVTGAVRAFQSDAGLTMDGDAGPSVWAHLLTAAVKDKVNPHGYTYALASQYSPDETLKVWHNGKVVLNTSANTGIPGAATADGTYPVYERLPYQVMKGTNPDGSKYADPVYWVAYFNGGDAVHYFSRYSYGSYQSLGCVELPWKEAKFIWPYLTYGSLVTVRGPVA